MDFEIVKEMEESWCVSDQVISRTEMVAQPPDIVSDHAESYMYRVSIASVDGLCTESSEGMHEI